MCGHGHQFHQRHSGCGCCCPPRSFLTKAEQLERLERYAAALEKELAGLKEHIEKVKKES